MKSFRRAILAAFVILSAAKNLPAQFVGYYSPQTVGPVKLFNAASATGASANVANLGQSVHFFMYTTSGVVNALSIQLEGSADGVNFLRISDSATNTTAGALYGVSYLPFIRANITIFSGTGNVTGYYTGTSVSPIPGVGAFAQSGTNMLTLGLSQPANTTKIFNVNLTSAGVGGTLYFLYNGTAPTGGSLTVTAGPDTSHLATAMAATSIAANNLVQTFQVAVAPASVSQVTFTSPGVTSATYDLFYAFGGSLTNVTQASQVIARVTPAQSGFTLDYDSGITVVPTTSTVVTASTTLVMTIYCSNTTAIAATVTVTDNQATPAAYVSNFSLAGNSNVQFVNTVKGLKFQNGIKWSQGTANAINCQIAGYQ